MKKAIYLTIAALALLLAFLAGCAVTDPLRRSCWCCAEHERLYHLVPLRRLLAQ